MDIPIRRIPPMVGPQPPAAIPRLGDRPPQQRKQQFSLDAENKENEGAEDSDDSELDITENDESAQGDSVDEVGPPEPGEAGQNLNVII